MNRKKWTSEETGTIVLEVIERQESVAAMRT
jgi:hypothetical protein